MRRLLVTAALAVTLLATGCSDDPDPAAGPSGTPTAGAGSGSSSGAPGGTGAPEGSPEASRTGTATGNAGPVCAAARQLGTDKVTTFISEVGRSLEATAANDAAKAATARRAAQKAVQEWSAGLRVQAARAEDPQLKAVLTQMATEAGRMTANVDAIDDEKLDQLQERLTGLCGE